ncbi:hypothetical protein B9Z55_025049 [Caenorhabditis nigoni]|nr:hypothetical protein B9Z55_025049 [Caenorhabditis nigoni]
MIRDVWWFGALVNPLCFQFIVIIHYPSIITSNGLIPPFMIATQDEKIQTESYFWQYSRHGKQQKCPQLIASIFEGKDCPPEIDAAFQLHNNASFLFHRDKYWKVSGSPMRIEPGYPRSLAKDWFNCA